MTAARTQLASPPSTLDLLRRRADASGRPWLGAAAYLAGERLSGDLQVAGMLPKVTMDWGRGGRIDCSRAGLNPAEAALAARQRATAALRAVGPDFAGVLMDVCGFDKGLEAMERERHWPVRSAKVVVRLALDALARHYGYADQAEGQVSGRMRTWAAAGAKPGVTV